MPSSPTFKTDAIRFTAGCRPGGLDTLSTGSCPPAASLEKTSSSGPGEATTVSSAGVDAIKKKKDQC